MTLKEKAKQSIKLAGLGTFPRWRDCPDCGAKLVCVFDTYAYAQHYRCPKAKPSEEYSHAGIDQAFKSKQVAGVFEGKGTRFFTNNKGNVIRTEPMNRPLPVGKKDW